MGMGYKYEFLAIKAICDAFGCGNVMEWASAINRYNLAKEGLPINVAFVCVLPAIFDNPNDNGIRIGEGTRELYDGMVKRFMEEEQCVKS